LAPQEVTPGVLQTAVQGLLDGVPAGV
jgi:hypothetical protein